MKGLRFSRSWISVATAALLVPQLFGFVACGRNDSDGAAAGRPAVVRDAEDIRAPTRAALKIGDPAPLFSLAGSDGRTYSLADYKGKQTVVLAWIVKAFSEP